MEIRQIPKELTYDLRSRVLRPGMPLEASFYPADPVAVHFAVLEDGVPVSVVTAHPENHPLFTAERQWRIRGMATEPGRRGEGFGRMVLNALLEWGRSQGFAVFWCNARERAIPFYERAGFLIESELFEIPGIGPHKVLRINL